MVILGIDPGTAATGYGIIEISSPRRRKQRPLSPPLSSRRGGGRGRKGEGGVRLVEYGCITTSKTTSPEQRLAEIYRDLNKLIKKYRPKIIAVESLFFFKNLKTAISVAQARGVILLCAAQNNIKLMEFTPLQIKMALTSYGRADKKQIQYMVRQLLNLKSAPKPDDAADALAIAICAANQKVG